jgi:transcription elongation factor
MSDGSKAAPEHNRGRGESRMDAEGRVGDGILVFDGVHRYDTGVIVRITKSRCYFCSNRHGDVR